MQKIAVLLHLANTDSIGDFSLALTEVQWPFDLYVNLVEDLNTQAKLSEQRARLLEAFPDATVICSTNRGMDVGGMFRLFDLVKEKEHSALLYMHSKSDPAWRKSMLEVLSKIKAPQLEQLLNPGFQLGMVGTYSYPFDYFNVRPFLELAAELDITLSTSWDSVIKQHPNVKDLPIEQRIHWAKGHNVKHLRPEVDLEYAELVLGEPSQCSNKQSMQQSLLKLFIADGVLGPLPYFPGNYFWISGQVLQMLSQRIDFAEEFEKLSEGLASDSSHQSRAHAWERILPVFVRDNQLQTLALARPKTPLE